MVNGIIKYFLENKLVTVLTLAGLVAWGTVSGRSLTQKEVLAKGLGRADLITSENERYSRSWQQP